MGLANLAKMNYSSLLVNKFYFGILVHADEYKNIVRFRDDVLYTFFDGKEHILSEIDLGKLHGREHYTGPHKTPTHYAADNLWNTLSR